MQASLKDREQARLDLLTDIAELQRKAPGQEVYLTVPETATLCYCSDRSVRRLIRGKQIEAVKPTRELRVLFSSVQAHIDKSKAYAISGCRDSKRVR